MRRVKLGFSRGLLVEFTDRAHALNQLSSIASRGLRLPVVIYGPEGCGKTALLRQASLILEDYGYQVVYVNPGVRPLGESLYYTESLRGIVSGVLRDLINRYSGDMTRALVDFALAAVNVVLKRVSKPRIAVLVDDVFSILSPGEASLYAKSALNLIEHPPGDYDRIVVLIAASEGVSRRELGRHTWASLRILWNMGYEGFKTLYGEVSELIGGGVGVEEAWTATGGNPRLLGALIEREWSIDEVVEEIITGRALEALARRREWRSLLEEALENPDILAENYQEEVNALLTELVKLNMIVENLPPRKEALWIDKPPPQRDEKLGIGRYVAWQTPLHREAVRVAIERTRPR